MIDKIKTGRDGEQKAADYFSENGFEVLERNYRYRRSEIDLIVRRDNLLIFVEVKARKNSDYGHPEAFVDARKAEKIREGAEHYIEISNWTGNIRFDIIAIETSRNSELTHFEDAIQ